MDNKYICDSYYCALLNKLIKSMKNLKLNDIINIKNHILKPTG